MWVFINAKTICRNCLDYNGELGLTKVIKDEEPDVYDNYIKKTEFEVSELFEEWIKEENKTCEKCNSSNFVFTEITVEDHYLFDFFKIEIKINDKNEFFLCNYIEKRGEEFEYIKDVSKNCNNDFLFSAQNKIIEIISKSNDNKFIPNNNGLFYLFISGYMDINNNICLKIERFITYGITKEEILEELTKHFV